MSLFSDPIRARKYKRLAWPSFALCGVGLFLSGCPMGAPLDNAEEQLNIRSGLAVGEACDPTPIFEGCSGSICHGSDDGSPPSGGVVLIGSPAEVAAALLDVDASYPDLSGCPDVPEKLVDSSNLEASLLWTKLNDTQQCGDGMPIPHSIAALDPTDLECVRSYMEGLIADAADGGDGSGGADATGSGGDAGDSGGSGSGGDAMASGGADGSGGADAAATVRVEAECALGAGVCGAVMGSNTGAAMLENGDTTVGYISDGVTLTYAAIETSGQDTLILSYAKANTDGTMEVRLDSATGTLLATVTPTGTGDWVMFEPLSVPLGQTLTGAQTLVFVANGMSVLNLDWFELSAGGAQ